MLAITHSSERRMIRSAYKSTARTVDEHVADDVLIKAVAAGDKQAMHVIYDRHNTKMYRHVLRLMSNLAVAEDVVSDVFLNLWRARCGHHSNQ